MRVDAISQTARKWYFKGLYAVKLTIIYSALTTITGSNVKYLLIFLLVLAIFVISVTLCAERSTGDV